jgi:hypothetical protein
MTRAVVRDWPRDDSAGLAQRTPIASAQGRSDHDVPDGAAALTSKKATRGRVIVRKTHGR